jgi:alkanesulfonate monooxygenase SsuD/methylene tetrahydromethanopterin reductase-like flavin-dependent oxidoreductase (luciferase family)
VLAKELATIASLTGGRLVAGVGIGWNIREYRNLGMEDRFRVRGAYLDETIALWRHLWSGSEAPFEGRFHQVHDALFAPLPPHGAALPIIVGGRSDQGVQRAGRLGDGYQLSQNGPAGMAARLPILHAAADAAGRPMPRISARAPIYFGAAPAGATPAAIHGTPEEIGRVVDAWISLGLDELLIDLDETDPERAVAKMERLHADVLRSRMPVAAAS